MEVGLGEHKGALGCNAYGPLVAMMVPNSLILQLYDIWYFLYCIFFYAKDNLTRSHPICSQDEVKMVRGGKAIK